MDVEVNCRWVSWAYHTFLTCNVYHGFLERFGISRLEIAGRALVSEISDNKMRLPNLFFDALHYGVLTLNPV